LSVAFTKEESAETASETLLPDRPISSHLNLVTEQGFVALERQLQEAKSAYEAAQGADALAIVTEWQEFRSPDFDRLKQILKAPVIFDGRNLYEPSMLSRFGLTYYAIGRGRPLASH